MKLSDVMLMMRQQAEKQIMAFENKARDMGRKGEKERACRFFAPERDLIFADLSEDFLQLQRESEREYYDFTDLWVIFNGGTIIARIGNRDFWRCALKKIGENCKSACRIWRRDGKWGIQCTDLSEISFDIVHKPTKEEESEMELVNAAMDEAVECLKSKGLVDMGIDKPYVTQKKDGTAVLITGVTSGNGRPRLLGHCGQQAFDDLVEFDEVPAGELKEIMSRVASASMGD